MDFERVTPAVERAARIAKSSFPAHYDLADVKQDLWVWILENKGTVTRILGDSEGTDAALIDLLLKAANAFLKKEDAASYGYSEEDQYYYSLDLIKSILEVVFKYEDWQSFASVISDMPKIKSDPSKSGNNLASYVDVRRAVDQLPEDQYNAIVWRYKYGYTQQRLGSELGISREAARQRLEGALSAIRRSLGKKGLGELRNPPKVAVRPSTASVIARTESDYEG